MLISMSQDGHEAANRQVHRGHSLASSPVITAKSVNQERLKIQEVLMQELLKVDGITVSSEEDEAGKVRARRKEVVKYIQSLIDKVDQIHQRIIKK